MNNAHTTDNTPDITDLTIDGILTVDIIHFDRRLDRIVTRREQYPVRGTTVDGVESVTLQAYQIRADKVLLSKFIVADLSGYASKDIATVKGYYRAI